MIKKILKKLFKFISYGIFFKIYGKIEKSIEISDDKRVKINITHKENNLKYNIYNIANGRLYTDRIQDTAILLDNKIINQPSFQLRRTHDSKIYNSKVENNIVFKNGTPRILKKINGSMLSMLTGGGGNNNYWHWLFDVLPRLSLYNDTANTAEIDYYLLPDIKKRYQTETLDYLKIPENKRLSSEKFRHVKAKRLIVTDHPVMVTGNATKDIMNMPAWISFWLKNTFVNKNIENDENSKKKIYIDRSSSDTKHRPQRLISNENEVKNYLLNNQFVSVKLHETNFIEQVKLFRNAECIVGLHGGGFANLAFCKPGTRVIELRSSNAGVPIENLAKKNNLNYNSVIVEAKQIESFNFPNQQGSIHVPLTNLIELIKN